MAGRQATGNMTLHMDINNAAVGYKLRTMQRQIHQVNRAWKYQAHMLWINGQREEALRTKMTGVQREADIEAKYIHKANKSIQASNDAHEQGNKKYQRLKINRAAAIEQLNEYRNQLRQTKDVLVLHNNELLRTSRIERGNSQEGRAHVDALRAEGRETDAAKQQTTAYNRRLSDLNRRLRAVYGTIRLAKNKGLNDSTNPDYTAARQQYFQLRKSIADTTKAEKDFNSGLTDTNKYNQIYNATTNQVVASLKRMKQNIQANRFEYNRLTDHIKSQKDALDAESEKAQRVASVSGKNSIAFQTEYKRLSELQAKYREQTNRINILSSTYGHMSSHTAAAYDNMSHKMNRLNLQSHKELVNAHALTNASLALGSGFVYGARQAMGLENQFNRVRNLLNTSGETYRQSTREIQQMGDATARYSMQYGVSQKSISKGYEELVRRGYSGNQALASQKSYLQGAIASGDKYSDVMDTAASTLEAFGMRSDNTRKMVGNTKTAVNQLAYAADLTATDFSGIGYGMKFTGATAHSANQSLGETASALGVLSNNGQDATNAGFGLRKVLNSFISSKDTKAWKKVLPQLGLSPNDFQNAEGHFKKLSTMMSILNSHMKGKTDAEKTDIFHQLFGATGQESALILARNTGNLAKLNGQVAKSQDQDKGRGYAARIARKNMNSTAMQMKRLQQAGSYLAQTYAQGLNPEFKRFANVGLTVVNFLRGAPKPFKDLVSVGTAAIPIFAGLNYALAGFNKVRAMAIQNGLKMVGIGKTERQRIVDLSDATDKQTEAEDNHNKSMIETIHNYRAQKQAAQEAAQARQNNTKAENDNTQSDDENTVAKDSNTKADQSNTTANSENTTSVERESEADNTATTLAERHPKTIGAFDNVTGSALGTGYTKAALKHYGRWGAGMGAFTGLTEAASGDPKGGVEDAVGVAGGTALGGIAGPIGAMIGGTVGPMLSRSIGNGFEKTIKASNKVKVHTSNPVDMAHTRDFNSNLRGISSSSRRFVTDEARLQQTATEKLAANGGKLTSSIRSTYTKMTSLAMDYGKKELKTKKSNLDKLHKQGLLSTKNYQRDLSLAQRRESKTTRDIEAIHHRLLTSDIHNAKQRRADLAKLNKDLLNLTNSGAKRQKKLVRDLANSTTKLTEKSYKHVMALRNKNYHDTIDKANAKYRSQKRSLDKDLATSSQYGKRSYDQVKRRVDARLKQDRKERDNSISDASNERRKVTSAADKRTDVTVREAYRQEQEEIKASKRTTSVIGSLWNWLKDVGKSASHAHGRRPGGNTTYAVGTPDTQALHFANGSLPGIQRNENAVINDGGGRELMKLPNGQFVLPGGRDVHTYLPKGTSIFNAEQTREILAMINQPTVHHAEGTVAGGLSGGLDGLIPKGIKNSLDIKLPDGNFDKTEKNTKRSMKRIHDLIDQGYKDSNKDAQGHLDDFHDSSDNSWIDTAHLTRKHVKSIHDDTTDRYKDLKDNINNIQDKSNSLTNDHLDTTVKYFKHHFSMIPPISRSSMREGVNNINSGIAAIDRILNQFGGNAHVLNMVHYAAGTSGPSMNKQLAVVNDATSGPRQEAIVSDQGRVRMPIGNNAITMLNPGDKVLNGTDTLRAIKTGLIPHYAHGKHSHKGLLDMIHQYAKTPSSFTNGTFNKFAIIMGDVLSQGMTSASKKGAQSPINAWSNAMWNYINSLVSESNSKIVSYARDHYTGKKYKMGATGPTYYDCSGLVDAVMRHFNIDLPRVTTGMQSDSSQLRYIGKNPKDAKPGNLVIWGHGGGAGGHVGFYEGGNRFFSDMSGYGASSTPLSDVTALPLAGFYQIKGMHDDRPHTNGRLTNLVKHQLGSKAIKWIKDKLNDADMGNPAGSGVDRWVPVIKEAARRMHADLSGGGLEKVLTTIRHESQGDPTVTQHGYTDANTGGNEAVGLVQFAKSTFPTYSLAGHDNRRNGYDELLALFNDSNWKSDLMPSGGWSPSGRAKYSKVPGYANGGLTTTEKLAHISEGNKPEMVLPLTEKSRAVELMLKSLNYMFGNQQDNDNRQGQNQASNNEQVLNDRRFEEELIQSNRNKDRLISNMLNKMNILIKVVQNKPVLTKTDIFKANRDITQKKLRLRSLNHGTF